MLKLKSDMLTLNRNSLAALRARLTLRRERSGGAVVIFAAESSRKVAEPPKKPWHAPQILDLGSRPDLDERAEGSSGGRN